MNVDTKETPFFVCPTGCEKTTFYQDGTLEVTRHFSSEGEKLESSDNEYGFTPKTEMKCRRCDAVAVKKIKRVTITTVIE
ncbi:MAG: hypothetical protein WCG01_02195 [bacterium]